MSPILIGNIQFTLALLVYAMIAWWYVHPGLKIKPWDQAVIPLLLVHAFRFGPLTLLMPGQADPSLPLQVKETIAYGDLLSSLLAILALFLIRFKIPGSRIMVWIFSVVGIVDIIIATLSGIQAGALDLAMGFNLYILNFYVPMLIVTHVLILMYLIKARS